MTSEGVVANSFIVKVWLEELNAEPGLRLWRGRITHVPSGAYIYFQKLEEVCNFIAPYLQEMGVEVESGDE